MKTITGIAFLLALLTFSSCSIQKRHYRSGYSITWNHPQQADQKSRAAEQIPENTQETILSASTASAENILPPASSGFQIAEPSLPKDTCDVIETKTNGNISARVLEISPSVIRYRPCYDVYNTEVKEIPRNQVDNIIYSNGMSEKISPVAELVKAPATKKRKTRREEPLPGEPKDHIQAKMAWNFGIAAYIPVIGWIFALLAIIHGLSAYFSIKNNPERYKGSTQAMVGIWLGVAGLILGAIAVILVFGVLMGVIGL